MVDFDVVVYVCPGLLPESEFVPCAGQRLRRGLVEWLGGMVSVPAGKHFVRRIVGHRVTER